jgi:hypothetical protein
VLAPCVTLWIGPQLGAVERACLKSVISQGHPLALYCYDVPEGVPTGVEVRDAASILPRDRVIRHRSGSVALFSNWFRYELQRRELGIWLDTDVYLLRPITLPNEYIMGEQAAGKLNNAVLRIPPNSPVLPALLELFEEKIVPRWIPLSARVAARWRLARSGRVGLSHMPWGVTGPLALTAIAEQYGLATLALPRGIFYPVAWQDAEWVCNQDVSVDQMITPDTVGIHLWNERIKRFKNLPAPAHSFLERLHTEGAL